MISAKGKYKKDAQRDEKKNFDIWTGLMLRPYTCPQFSSQADRYADVFKENERKTDAEWRAILMRGRKQINTKKIVEKLKDKRLTISLEHCHYTVVKEVAIQNGLRVIKKDEEIKEINIYWTDLVVSSINLVVLTSFQITNHFPGMNEICRKDYLSTNLNRMKLKFPLDYDFFPMSWVLPAEMRDLEAFAEMRQNTSYIVKPFSGCQGRGIYIVQDIKEINSLSRGVCQVYIDKPLLIDNFKFDLRIYVLITSVVPLRVYVFNEGMARFATREYDFPSKSNIKSCYMHLTNYSINRRSENYVHTEDGGSKRKLSSIYENLKNRRFNVDDLSKSIDDIILKTIMVVHPVLKREYKAHLPNRDTEAGSACFEILGFDILIDCNLKPYVIEVNHSPSFHTDTRLDKELKTELIKCTFDMLNLDRLDKNKIHVAPRNRMLEQFRQSSDNPQVGNNVSTEQESEMDEQFAHEMANRGNYRLLYPSDDKEKYDVFMNQMAIFHDYQETATSIARAQANKANIDRMNQRRKEDEEKIPKPKIIPAEPIQQFKKTTQNKVMQKRFVGLPNRVRPTSAIERYTQTLLMEEIDENFKPAGIDSEDEFERRRSNNNRGRLTQALGVDYLSYEVLRENGDLRPNDKRLFEAKTGLRQSDLQRYENSLEYRLCYPGKRRFLSDMPYMNSDQKGASLSLRRPQRVESDIDLEFVSCRKNLTNSFKKIGAREDFPSSQRIVNHENMTRKHSGRNSKVLSSDLLSGKSGCNSDIVDVNRASEKKMTKSQNQENSKRNKSPMKEANQEIQPYLDIKTRIKLKYEKIRKSKTAQINCGITDGFGIYSGQSNISELSQISMLESNNEMTSKPQDRIYNDFVQTDLVEMAQGDPFLSAQKFDLGQNQQEFSGQGRNTTEVGMKKTFGHSSLQKGRRPFNFGDHGRWN